MDYVGVLVGEVDGHANFVVRTVCGGEGCNADTGGGGVVAAWGGEEAKRWGIAMLTGTLIHMRQNPLVVMCLLFVVVQELGG